MSFAYPWLLAALALIPLIAWRLGKTGPLPSVTLPTIKPLAGLGRAPRRHTGRFRWPLTLIALTLMIVAVARPRVPRGETPDPSKGIDIMLTLDFSRSMAEEDFRMEGKRVSRRAALQKVVEEFVANRPHDRIGIVCFARSPALVSPLTLDHEWAMNSLRETDYMTGTAIGEGMAASLQFLKRHSQRSKVIILVTDGQNMIGRPPLAIAPFISRENIRMHSILIGAEIVPPSAAARHELNRAARMTGGQFFQARDAESLARIYGLIDQLEKKALQEKRFLAWNELFPWLVGAAVFLVMADFAGREVFWRRLP